MNKMAVRDYRGKNYGYITTDSDGNKYVTDWKGTRLGSYDAKRDMTLDWKGNIIARGDMASSLIKFD